MIKETTTATYYSITDLPLPIAMHHNRSYASKAMKKCDCCKKDNLEADYIYCPQCGRKFKD